MTATGCKGVLVNCDDSILTLPSERLRPARRLTDFKRRLSTMPADRPPADVFAADRAALAARLGSSGPEPGLYTSALYARKRSQMRNYPGECVGWYANLPVPLGPYDDEALRAAAKLGDGGLAVIAAWARLLLERLRLAPWAKVWLLDNVSHWGSVGKADQALFAWECWTKLLRVLYANCRKRRIEMFVNLEGNPARMPWDEWAGLLKACDGVALESAGLFADELNFRASRVLFAEAGPKKILLLPTAYEAGDNADRDREIAYLAALADGLDHVWVGYSPYYAVPDALYPRPGTAWQVDFAKRTAQRVPATMGK